MKNIMSRLSLSKHITLNNAYNNRSNQSFLTKLFNKLYKIT